MAQRQGVDKEEEGEGHGLIETGDGAMNIMNVCCLMQINTDLVPLDGMA